MSEKSYGFVRDNALSLAFGALFLGSLVGLAFAGTADYNAQLAAWLGVVNTRTRRALG